MFVPIMVILAGALKRFTLSTTTRMNQPLRMAAQTSPESNSPGPFLTTCH